MRISGLVLGLCRIGLVATFAYAGYLKVVSPSLTDTFLSELIRLDLHGTGFAIGAVELVLALLLALHLTPRLRPGWPSFFPRRF
jgi:uncharacterized membrane protein YphA (DoxX/SURF4 family)